MASMASARLQGAAQGSRPRQALGQEHVASAMQASAKRHVTASSSRPRQSLEQKLEARQVGIASARLQGAAGSSRPRQRQAAQHGLGAVAPPLWPKLAPGQSILLFFWLFFCPIQHAPPSSCRLCLDIGSHRGAVAPAARHPAPAVRLRHPPILLGSSPSHPSLRETPVPTPSLPGRKVPRARDLPPLAW
eukprot:15460621-Alexandrium_andersonii.AAC.1